MAGLVPPRLDVTGGATARVFQAKGAARPSQKGRGERPPGLADKRFTSAYIFAAVRPGTDEALAWVMAHANKYTMQFFLDEFSAERDADEHAVMVLDQAGWHDARAVGVPANVTLVPLPAYSPELNPVERVWLYLKERYLSHRLLDDDDDAVLDATCTPWNRLRDETGRVQSLCSYPWIEDVIT